MKKILNYLLLFVILVPLKSVKADMAAPSEYKMSATCNIVDGCNYYDDYRLSKVVGKIEYQEEVEVEYYDDDYMSIEYERTTPYCDEDDEDCDEDEYDDYDIFYIKSSDFINTAKSEVTPDDKQVKHLSKSVNMIITNKKGTTIYTGPNSKFKSLGTVPYNFEYDVEYGFMGGEGYGENTPVWAYISYKGISGWIEVFGNGVYKLDSTRKYITPNKTKFGSKYIPAGTVIDVDYSFVYTIYFEYDGEYRTMNRGYLAYTTTDALKLKKKSTIYSEASKSKSITTIPSGTILFPLYEYSEDRENIWYYVEYNGKKGWILFNTSTNNIKRYFESDKNYPEKSTEITKPTDDPTVTPTTDPAVAEKTEPTNEPEVTIPTTGEKTEEETKNSFELKGVNLVIFCVGLSILVAVITAFVVLKIGKKND